MRPSSNAALTSSTATTPGKAFLIPVASSTAMPTPMGGIVPGAQTAGHRRRPGPRAPSCAPCLVLEVVVDVLLRDHPDAGVDPLGHRHPVLPVPQRQHRPLPLHGRFGR